MVSFGTATDESPGQWNAQDHGGFSTSAPWMRVNDDYVYWNAEIQVADSSSVLAHWRRVLACRKQHYDTLIYGRFEMVDRHNPFIFCYKRVGKAAKAVVVANFTDDAQRWVVPWDVEVSLAKGQVILANYDVQGELHDDTLLLRPYESFVLLEQGEQGEQGHQDSAGGER